MLARAAASDDLLMCARPNQDSASRLDVLDWAKLAVACDMQALLVQCEYYIIGHFDKVGANCKESTTEFWVSNSASTKPRFGPATMVQETFCSP